MNSNELITDYPKLLKQYIKNSHMRLDELSEKLEERGLSASYHYLSKLQNGKVPPASEALNRAIADITKGDPDRLILSSYIQKAPKEVYDFITHALEQQEKLKTSTLRTDILKDEKTYKAFRGFLLDRLDEKERDILAKQITTPQGLINYYDKNHKKFFTENPIDFKNVPNTIMNRIRREERDANLKEQFGMEYRDDNPFKSAYNIATVSEIYGDKTVINEDNFLYYSVDEENEIYDVDNLIFTWAKDNAMSNKRILKGDKILIHLQQNFEDGDVVLINENSNIDTLREIKKLGDDTILLIASDNSRLIELDDDIRLVGKVIKVIFEP